MTSYGQSLLRSYLTILLGETPIENHRPLWLRGMEIDLFFPSFAVGFEFQGDQHFINTDFGTPWAQRDRDKLKRKICKENGVELKCLQAIDLEYTRIKHLLKRCGLKRAVKRGKADVEELRALNRKATEYRSLLRWKYQSPTTYRNGPKKNQMIRDRR